jgi:hypothetical protein
MCFHSQVSGWEIPSLLGSVEGANFTPISEKLWSFSLEYGTMDEIQKFSNSERKYQLVTLLYVITGKVTVTCKYDSLARNHYYINLNSFK